MKLDVSDHMDVIKQDEDEGFAPQKKKAPNFDEINTFMQEQRYAQCANRAGAEAEPPVVDMDDMVVEVDSLILV
jgi:hypothetical protein